MSNQSPKPLRPTLNQGIFVWSEPEPVQKSFSPIREQRIKDGTPLTTQGAYRGTAPHLRPAGPKLTLNGLPKATPLKKSQAPVLDVAATVSAFLKDK